MREIDWLDGAHCGAEECKATPTVSRYKILVFEIAERICRVEVLLCDEHARIADTDPKRLIFPQEEAMRWVNQK